jgi:hypothetical protein
MLFDDIRESIIAMMHDRVEKSAQYHQFTPVIIPQQPDNDAVFGTAVLNRQAIITARDARLDAIAKAANPYHLGSGQQGGGQFTSAAQAGGASPVMQPPKPPQPGAHAAVPMKPAPKATAKPAIPNGPRGPVSPPKPAPKKPAAVKKPAKPPVKAPAKGTPTTPVKKPAKQELSEIRAQISNLEATLKDLRAKKARLVAAGSASTSSGGPAKNSTRAGTGAAAGAASAAKPAKSTTASTTSASTASATTSTPSAQLVQQVRALDNQINATITQITKLKAQEQHLLHP